MLRDAQWSVRAALVLGLLAGFSFGQQPHPRLLFKSSDVPGLQAKVNAAGTPPAVSYSQMVSSAGLQTGSSQFSYVVYRSLRRMQEVAFRYQMTGNTSYGNNAKNLLMTMVNFVSPSSTNAYLSSTYPCALALTFDWVYPLLSSSEKAAVVAEIESWVTTMRNGSNGWASYSSYQAATDNHSMAWCTGIAFSLMAIEGDSNYPNLQGLITQNLQKLHDGWNDAISPDGSVDESYGYSNYGNMYSMNAGVAAINCGYGDWMAGTNVLKTPRWLATSLVGQSFVWYGDSSPSHKGNRIDPICYYPLTRSDSQDAAALWGINRIMAIEPPGDSTPSQAWSPHVHRAIYYPSNLTEQVPELLSGFFRDNLNQGSAYGNKLTAYPQVGQGGHAIMHNSTNPSWGKMAAYYLIRDEWMTHNHEDDGHFSLAVDGEWAFLDLGYSQQGGGWFGSQSVNHNIVTVQGASQYGGSGNNYYNPPSTNGRFLGETREAMMSPWMDYVHGSHAHMWMMQTAERSVIMIKDAAKPYTILVDHVDKGSGTHVYEEIFHCGGQASGQGTLASPMSVSVGGTTNKSVWLAPANVTRTQTASGSHAAGSYWRNKVTASGTDVTFVSIHGKDMPGSATPLASPLPNTRGATLSFGNYSDTILVRNDSSSMGDAATQANAQFLWIRKSGSAITAWSAGEATTATHLGTALVTASEKVTVAARGGRVFVDTETGDGINGLSLSLHAPFTVSEFVVDGQQQTIAQYGTTLVLGGTPLPTPSNDDRIYTFKDGYLWDAANVSGSLVVAQNALISTNGWGSFRLKGGDWLGGRPMSLGMTVAFQSLGVGSAGFKLESIPGAGDALQVIAIPHDVNHFALNVSQGGTFLGQAVVPYDLSGLRGRYYVYFSPLNGTIQIQDAEGAPTGTFSGTAVSSNFQVRMVMNDACVVDDVSLFDSAEDGVHPQGVAFWANQIGVAGFAIRTPNLIGIQDWNSVHNGQYGDPWLTQYWFLLGGLQETFASAYTPLGQAAAATLEEANWEFAVPAVNTFAGESTGIRVLAPSGLDLIGVVSY